MNYPTKRQQLSSDKPVNRYGLPVDRFVGSILAIFLLICPILSGKAMPAGGICTTLSILRPRPDQSAGHVRRKPVKRAGERKKIRSAVAKSIPTRRKRVTGRGAKPSVIGHKPARVATVKKAPVPTAKAPMVLTVPLFGPKYARVVVMDQQLRGSTIYLSSGHGGPDPGAIGRSGTYLLPEDEYAYDVTVRLARVLMEHGATVYVIVQDSNDGIRDTGILGLDYDEKAYPQQTIPLSQLARLKQGTMAVNNLYTRHKGGYQRSIIIHVDSRSIGQTIDVFFYHHDRSAAGQKLAKHIHRSFTARYKRAQPGRGYQGKVSTRNALYVVKNTLPPTVFIELGNIQNGLDQRRFLIPDNRQALANWLYEGVQADFRAR